MWQSGGTGKGKQDGRPRGEVAQELGRGNLVIARGFLGAQGQSEVNSACERERPMEFHQKEAKSGEGKKC